MGQLVHRYFAALNNHRRGPFCEVGLYTLHAVDP
jgi:hypothetical protein